MKRILFLVIASAGLSSLASAAVMFSECPAIGVNTGCAVLITLNANGTSTATVDPSQGPYDGSDDTIVGVLNNSTASVGSLPLTGGDIFGFDGDGMCSVGFGAPGNCSLGLNQGDPYDYSGDFVTFSVTDANDGSVNFVGGLASGQSTYFSLEEAPQQITVGPPSPSGVPEPATVGLMTGSGLLLYGFSKLRRKR